MINPLAAYVIVLHQQELLDEARSRQTARSAQLANPEVPAWRRSLAAGARRLSDVFASAARSIDPAVDCADAAAA